MTNLQLHDAAAAVERFAKDPSQQPLYDSDKIYQIISVLDDLTAKLFDVADEYRERERQAVEPKKESHPSPGVEIISKVLSAPDNRTLIVSMIKGLMADNDPRADKYVSEYFEKITKPETAYDFEQLLSVPPTPST